MNERSQPITVELIYDQARARSIVDHLDMVNKFMAGEVEIASPCGMEREREYIIADFAAHIARLTAVQEAEVLKRHLSADTDLICRLTERCEAYKGQVEAGAARIADLDNRVKALEAALGDLIDAKALAGVRGQVAGWNGEGRDEPFRERHPYKLGATLGKTCCGHVYELDDALQAARALMPGEARTAGKS